MTILQKTKKIITDKNVPCVTISFNTRATFDKSKHDDILLKNLIKEAKRKIDDNYRERELTNIIQALKDIPSKIDMRSNAKSLHIFISNKSKEIIYSPWPVVQNTVLVSDHFNLKPLIVLLNRTSEYLILLLSKGGSNIYQAINDDIVEIRNDDFPIDETPFFVTSKVEASNAKLVDDLAKEYLNRVDKAVLKLVRAKKLPCVVIATEDNYTKLMQVADNKKVYVGFDNVNYNDTSHHTLASQGWNIMQGLHKRERLLAVEEMEEAIGKAEMCTDLQEILLASEQGRGELLLVRQDFFQDVVNSSKRIFSIAQDNVHADEKVDIISDIAWNIYSNGGRVYFLEVEEMGNLGKIALRLRF